VCWIALFATGREVVVEPDRAQLPLMADARYDRGGTLVGVAGPGGPSNGESSCALSVAQGKARSQIVKYHIKGAHRETAEDLEVIYEAESEQKASIAANNLGLMVESIKPYLEGLMEYHTVRCNFSDLQQYLNQYAEDEYQLNFIYIAPDRMCFVVVERPLKPR
jgi:hypothetical protein